MLNVPRLHAKIATDTIFVKNKSLRNNIASQLYTHKCGFNISYHLSRENGENIGNNSGIVNGELDGAGDKVGSSTNNLEEEPWSSYIVTTVWAENLEEYSENIYWSKKHN